VIPRHCHYGPHLELRRNREGLVVRAVSQALTDVDGERI
jgi:hypothetical protein